MKKRLLMHDNYHNKERSMTAYKASQKPIGILLCIFIMMFSVIPSGIVKAETSTSTLSNTVKYGDINGDGTVSILDYEKLKSFLLGKVSTIDKTAADLNGDGKINSIDLALMKRFVLGNITKFPADKSTGTIIDIKPKFVEGLKAKLETISIIYTGDTTDLKNQLNQLVSATLKEDANGYNVASIQYSASGTVGNLTISFTIEYTAEVQGAKTIDEVKSKLVEGLTAKQQKIEVTYTGDVTDLSNKINQLVTSVLSENDHCYYVKTSSYSMDGVVGNVALTFEFTYSNEAIIIVNTLEEMKTTLIQNFKNKGAKLNVSYRGDATDLKQKIDDSVSGALATDSYDYFINSMGYSTISQTGNVNIEFEFSYNETPQIKPMVANTLDDMKAAIKENLKNRINSFSIFYKGDLTNLADNARNNVEQILGQDSYLKYSMSANQYSIAKNQWYGILNFECKYLTTKEQEDFVDNKVNLILSNIIDPEMTDDQKEKAIHDYILLNVDYDYTDSENKRRSAYDALHDGKTVCQGYALLANKMLTTAGIENKIIGGNDHAWNLVNIDSKWYHLDCTWDDGENNTDYYKYYNLTDEKMAADHVWDSSGTEKCQTDYITELQNQQDNPEMQEVLESIQESDVGVEDPNPSDGVTFMYNDILLKEGDSTDLFLDITAPDYLDSEIEWSSSDPTVVDIVYGTAVAKKAGTAFITAKFKNNPGYSDICSVKVIANNSDNGFTLQQLSEDNLSAFKNQEIKPVISIHSNDNINTNTVVSDCYSQLSDSIEMIGHPIDIKTDSQFNWAEIGFKLSDGFVSENDLSDIIICWYDEENNIIIPQATKIDYSNNLITATVPHFSKYFLAYKSKINKKQINIAGVIDTIYSSGSALDGYKGIIQNLMDNLIVRNEYNVNMYFVDTKNPNSIFLKTENQLTAQGVKITSDNKEKAEKVVTDAVDFARNFLNLKKKSTINLPKTIPYPLKKGNYHNYVLGFLDGKWYFTDSTHTKNNGPILKLPNSNTNILICDNELYYQGRAVSTKDINELNSVLPELLVDIFEVNKKVTIRRKSNIKENSSVLTSCKDVIIINDKKSMDSVLKEQLKNYSGKIIIGKFNDTGEPFITINKHLIISIIGYDIAGQLKDNGISYKSVVLNSNGVTLNIYKVGDNAKMTWQVVSKLRDIIRKSQYEFSPEGKSLLMAYELREEDPNGKKYFVYDSNGNIMGIRAYRVRDASGKDDGGITLGYGSFTAYSDNKGMENLLKKYGIRASMTDKELFNIIIPYNDCIEMMNAEITKQMPFLTRDFLCKYGIHVTQQEFDALIFHRYLNYRLNDKIQKLLKEGNRNRDDWKWAFMDGTSKTSGFYEGWLNRTLDELELFFDGDYKRTH